MHPSFQLLPARDYLAALTASVKKAKHSISIVALVIVDDETTHEFIDELVNAAERGVSVDIATDLYLTYRELGESGSKWHYIRHQLRTMRATKKRLEKAGARVSWLGAGAMTFISGRTHTKWSIIDDEVYSFGGVNLYSLGIANTDYMLHSRDKALAETMRREHLRLIDCDRRGRRYRSHEFIMENGSILVDGGIVGDSLIYRRTCKLASEANEILYVSQYCPTGKLGRILRHAPDPKLYFNPWKNADDKFNRMLIRWAMFVHRQITLYTRPQYLHAKFIIFTMPDGHKIALSGSHNFIAGAGMAGTREIALQTTDQHIIASLEKFHKKYIH